MKKIKKLHVIIFVILAVILAKDICLRGILSIGASRSIGVKVTVNQLSWKVFRNKIIIRELKVYNPKNFPDEPMLDVASIDIDYKLSELFNRKPRLSLMAMNVRETVIIKNKDRKLNINELTLTNDIDKGKVIVPVFPVQINLLKLDMGPVVFKDYSKSEKPEIKTFDIGLKTKEFKNIKSGRKLIALVLFNSIRRTSIKGAKIYALSAFLGPAGISVGLTGMLVGKDHADGEFNVPFDTAYDKVLSMLKNIGEVTEESREKGQIKGKVSSHSVSVAIESLSETSVKITASARKHKVPKPQFAGGILYQINQEIKTEETVNKVIK